jgi:hypothetical protein
MTVLTADLQALLDRVTAHMDARQASTVRERVAEILEPGGPFSEGLARGYLRGVARRGVRA